MNKLTIATLQRATHRLIFLLLVSSTILHPGMLAAQTLGRIVNACAEFNKAKSNEAVDLVGVGYCIGYMSGILNARRLTCDTLKERYMQLGGDKEPDMPDERVNLISLGLILGTENMPLEAAIGSMIVFSGNQPDKLDTEFRYLAHEAFSPFVCNIAKQ